VADSNAVYYYHFDGLGSVVALSDSNGDTVQSYEYTVYGQVAAEDPDHPNPYMFTGRRFDVETGLYNYRARCYNPHIGRFMQTDPVGYEAGMNLYLYCKNNPLVYTDPEGLMVIEEPDESDDVNNVNNDDGCDEEALVECMWDVAIYRLEKCTEKAAKARDYGFMFCGLCYEACIDDAQSLPWWIRPVEEYRCYLYWSKTCPAIVEAAYGMDMAGCLVAFAVDEVDCFAQYCPEKLELVIDFWRRYKWIEGKLDI
jgi:RHS repeat-associated protein